MDNLYEFLHFNNTCPVCQNPLTLYLQWINSVCFKAKKLTTNQYHFEQFKCKNREFEDNDFISLFEYGNSIETRFNSSKIANESKRYQMYFFYLCNSEGFKDIGSYALKDDYEINIHKGCYFRSTPFYEYENKNNSKHWQLTNYSNLINADEVFSFKKETEDLEKNYILQLNYTDLKTVLMHYSVTPKQRKDKDFEPNIFEKTLPPLGTRPNFDLNSRDELISRMDTWVLVS